MPGYAPRITIPDVQVPLWDAMRADRRPRSIPELHDACRAHPNAIQHRLWRWRRAGLVDRIEGSPPRFVMSDTAPDTVRPPKVDRAGTMATRVPTARERLWRAMRVLKAFDLPQLVLAAGVSRRSTEDYVNCLTRGDYLRRSGAGNGMTGKWTRYTLVRNAGPRTPKIVHGAAGGSRFREIVDPNDNARTDISPGRVSLRASDGGGVS